MDTRQAHLRIAAKATTGVLTMTLRDRATKPPGPWLDWPAVEARLQKSVNAAGGQSVWAAKHGISVAYVNDVLRGRRLPGDKITKAIGLEKALMWRTPAR